MKADPSSRPDEAGSMPLAMLITMVGVLLSGVLAATTAVQLDNSRNAISSERALQAAQAGLDAALAQIRAANDGTETNGEDDNGVLSKLPCGPLNGRVSAASTASYSVKIEYRTLRTGAELVCHGPKGPSFAKLISKGTDSTGGLTRTLEAWYTFRTTNKNIAGGRIPVYRTATSKELCLHATPDNKVTVELCNLAPGGPQQRWAYNSNLTITLVSSITEATPLGRCVDAGPVPHTGNNLPVTLQPCFATTQPRQQWSFNDDGNLEGTKSDGSDVDGYCLNVKKPDEPASDIVLKNGGGCSEAYTNVQNFNPDPDAGAGAAGAGSGQLVNFRQFGRCVDVPGQNWTRGYLTAWPCKQKPNPTQIAWNQRWTTPALLPGASSATGTISTQPNNTAFRTCITSPLTAGTTSYAFLSQCLLALGEAGQWTVNGDTGSYDTSFTIVDSKENCLSAADPADPATV
ncbi:MAG TPA: hypothetical protein VF657_21500, partial [Actinoplanes sp.]